MRSALLIGMIALGGLASPLQESKDRSCPKCTKKVESEWRYCPFDGVWLQESKGDVLDWKEVVSKGGLKIEVVSFRTGKPKVKDMGRERTLDEEFAVLKIKLTNVTDVKKIDYRYPFDGGTSKSPLLEDEHGNQYKWDDTADAWKTLDGTLLRSKPINPETSHEVAFLFELPVKKAERFVLSLDSSWWGAEGVVKVRFPRDLK